jgi:hypothetical protein
MLMREEEEDRTGEIRAQFAAETENDSASVGPYAAMHLPSRVFLAELVDGGAADDGGGHDKTVR